MDLATLNFWVAAGCVVVLAAVIGVRLTTRTGLPSLLLYLALGLVIGEAGFGIEFEDVQLTQNLGLLALAVILGDGGLTTRWEEIRSTTLFAIVLATLGVAISVATVAAGAYFLLGFELRTALLLGGIVSSTDAAAVFSVLRRLSLRPKVAASLEAESCFNDPPVIILVTVLVSDAWLTSNPAMIGAQLGFQLAVGTIFGLVIGVAGARLLSWLALPGAGLYPLATYAIVLFAYASASVALASGFIAVYLAGLVLGNSRLPHRRATLAVSEGAALTAQIGLFVLLGLLASPSRLPEAVLPALVAGLVLTFVARPVSVIVCATPFGFSAREQAFLSWAGLRGAVPIVLTTVVATAQLPGAERIFDIVFVLVVVYTLIQAPPLGRIAKWLDVATELPARSLAVESAPLDAIEAELLNVQIPAQSRLRGTSVEELRLGEGAAVTLIVRAGQSIVPSRTTVLEAGDNLLVVTTSKSRHAVERRLAEVDAGGRLARWLEP